MKKNENQKNLLKLNREYKKIKNSKRVKILKEKN